MIVEIIPCLQDNYSYLIIDESNNNACVIDPSEAEPIINFIEKENIHLKYILTSVMLDQTNISSLLFAFKICFTLF